jgi:peptidylprolyl isomerase
VRRLIPLALVFLVGLAGCSLPGGSDDDPTPTPLAVDVGADIASGCWNANQRTLALSDGTGGRQVQQWSEPPADTLDPAKTYTATVVTNKGTFAIELFDEEAPMAVNSFVCLARAGFFDGVVFHRIVAGFVIQGGDPTGTGTGGPGYEFDDEQVTRTYSRGTVAMANSGPDTNGSQFFVCLADVGLPPSYTIFGTVVSGMETVDAIAAVETELGGDGQMSSPLEPVVMESVTISEA